MKSEDSMVTKTRRQCTEVFKEQAVWLVRDSRHPIPLMARELGIADHLLYCWRGLTGHPISVICGQPTSALTPLYGADPRVTLLTNVLAQL